MPSFSPSSSSSSSSSSSALPSDPHPDLLSHPHPNPPRLHVQPHSAHLDPATATAAAMGDEDEEHDYESLPVGAGWGVNMAAGAMAGISEHAVIFPVDSVKTRMQVLPALISHSSPTLATSLSALSSSSSSSSSASSLSSASTSSALHTSSLRAEPPSTILSHFRASNLRSLWRGVASVIMGAGPAHAAHFGMYEFVREVSGGRGEGWGGVAGTALAGAAATISSDALMNPFDVIKQRMQIVNSPHRTVFSCAKTVYAREGLWAFYVSYPTTLAMTVPFTAVQFSVYESLKGVLNPEGGYSPLTHVVAGGFAGGVAAAVTTPLDVAKTLLQTRGSSTDPRIRSARGMAEALRIIRDRDGLRGLRRGMLPRVLTVAPSTAISWMSYEFFKVLIRQGGTMPETGTHY